MNGSSLAANESCVLERGTNYMTYLGLAIPVVLLVAGGFMARDHYRVLQARFAQPKKKRSKKKKPLPDIE